jgi:hypothetical protein
MGSLMDKALSLPERGLLQGPGVGCLSRDCLAIVLRLCCGCLVLPLIMSLYWSFFCHVIVIVLSLLSCCLDLSRVIAGSFMCDDDCLKDVVVSSSRLLSCLLPCLRLVLFFSGLITLRYFKLDSLPTALLYFCPVLLVKKRFTTTYIYLCK